MKRPIIHTFLALALLLVYAPTYAQKPQKSALLFSNTTIDLGHIDEDGGAVASFFEAVNTSKNTIEVENIATTCGCTTAEYNKNIVESGEIFRFKVIFNPLNRPGRIDKQIFVKTLDAEEEICLNIIGYVNARARTVEELYPFDMGGGLRLKSNFHAFGYLEHGKSLVEHIGYVNTSNKAINIDIIYEHSSGLLDITLPQRIEAGASGDITLCYAISETSDTYGTAKDVIRLIVDHAESNYPLSAQVIVVDNFDNMDDISAPKLVISKNIIKFGDVNSPNEILEQRLALKNEGGTPLKVRAIESSTRAVECDMERNMTIMAGEQTDVTVRLRAAHIEDVDNPLTARLSVITNDPMRPMQTVRVNAIPRGDIDWID